MNPEEEDNELPLFIPSSDKAIFLSKRAKREKILDKIKLPRKSILESSVGEESESLSDENGPSGTVSLENLSPLASPQGSQNDLAIKERKKSKRKRP
jgi:hypothetical protein